MARECLDFYGNWLHYPQPGGAIDQDEFEMECVRNAWAIERMFGTDRDSEFKKANARFRYWVLSKDDSEVWLNPWLGDEPLS